MKTIELTIAKSTVLDAVRSETLIKGNTDRAVDDKAARMAYHEIAGEDEYHMRKLERTLVAASEELKTHLCDSAISEGLFVGESSVVVDFDNENIYYHLGLSERFNEAYTDALARLASMYIQYRMLVMWWNTVNQTQAAVYAAEIEVVLADIMRCFNKIPPRPATYPFPKEITITNKNLRAKKYEDFDVTYSLGKNVVDDVQASVFPHWNRVTKKSSGVFTISVCQKGKIKIRLYSKHDPSVCAHGVMEATE